MLRCKTTVNYFLLRESAVSFEPLEHFKLSYVFLFRLFGGRGGTIFLII